MPLLGRRNVASATGPDGNRGNRLSLMQTPPLGRARPRVGIGPRLRRALGFLTAKQGLRVSTRWSRPWRQGHMCKDPTAPLSMAWAIAHRDKRAHQRPPRSSAIRRKRGAGRAALSRRIVDGQRHLVALGVWGLFATARIHMGGVRPHLGSLLAAVHLYANRSKRLPAWTLWLACPPWTNHRRPSPCHIFANIASDCHCHYHCHAP